ncbi:MAG: histidine kinase [Rubrivivax sp.]|nr:histidine kinase [Rubrivivax sp.]
MSSPPLALPLDEALPRELSGSDHGWLTHYRRYPVFSRPWVRGRWRLAGLILLLMLSLLAVGVWSAPTAAVPVASIPALLLQWGSPLVLGPLAGAWVRRQGWASEHEQRGLWAAMLALVLLLAAFGEWGAEPLKQATAEVLGTVGPDGKRQRVVMAVGVTLTSEDGDDSPPRLDSGLGPAQRAINAVFGAFCSFALGGGFAVLRWRRERELLIALARDRALAQAQAQRREAELRLSVLAAQVEPHFLFNTLAGVRSAIATDPARASDMVDRLVAYLRAAIPRLRSDGAAHTTLAQQAETVRAYLALMQSRMPRLRFELQIPPALATLPFPPLMLISLAENAVKHGVEPKIGPALVSLQAERDDQGRLAVTVADDGIGFGGASAQGSGAGSGLGLVNLRERLQQLYGGRAELQLKARPGGGVAATIAVPLDEGSHP